MKDILTRLFNHEELTSEETKQILLNITREAYPEAQISALLTVFQMRSITVDELIGFREALMETRIPIDFAPYRPIDIVGTEVTERTRSTFPLVPVLWWPEPVTKLPNTAIMVPLPSVGQAMSWSNTASASPMIPTS